MKLSINGLRFPCADICDWSNEGSSEGRGNTAGTISVTRESSETGMSFVRKKALQCLTSFLWPPCIRITFLLCMWKRITFKICDHNELQRHCFVHVFLSTPIQNFWWERKSFMRFPWLFFGGYCIPTREGHACIGLCFNLHLLCIVDFMFFILY
jgi:hypothetical protein